MRNKSTFLFFLFWIVLCLQTSFVRAQVPEKKEKSDEDSGYEIDYEEETDDAQVPAESPVQAKKKKALSSKTNNAVVQGSRAKDRFTPLMKIENKSVYKLNGRYLDVDTD